MKSGNRTSFAFLMEMLWVCGFFILTACIFVLAFVKADGISRRARDLNQAVLAAENAVEETFSQYRVSAADGVSSQTAVYFDREWNELERRDLSSEHVAGRPDGARYRSELYTSWKEGMLSVTVRVVERSGREFSEEPIYTLEGSHYYPPAE